MSRSGYDEGYELDNWALIKWRGAVMSALRGKRGQAALLELVDAMDAMPEHRLIANELKAGGEVCALGALGAKRGLNLERVDPEDCETVAGLFNIAVPMAREIVYENDEGRWNETPEERWQRMRAWAVSLLSAPALRTTTGGEE